ncbi:MAG: hypothetical protein QME51_03245 [Planctomycetota bacterium]|nr:hypothetical protein [Planctomycetota bacterium]MDI6787365.1 hypothetical protein [Planctomycetota bacterium]
MNALLAIVLLTYRESLRKKVLFVLLVFCAGLFVTAFFFPAISEEAKIKLLISWTLQSITFFAVLIAIFLSAVSIPSDIENKRMFLILAKPLSKETIIIGRLVGFIFTLFVIVLIMSLAGAGYIRLVSTFLSQGMATPASRIGASDFYFFSPSVVEGRTEEGGVEKWEATLEGEEDNFAAWKFSNLTKYHIPATDYTDDNVMVELNLKAGEGMGKISSEILVRIINPTTKEAINKKVEVVYKKPERVSFPKHLIDAVGDVKVYIYRLNPNSHISVEPKSVILLLSPTFPLWFEWNFFLSTGVIFLQVVLVLIFCVCCSSFLSGPVNIFLNMFLYFCGSGMNFLQDSLSDMKLSIAQQIKRLSLAEISGQIQRQSEGEIPLFLMQTSDIILDNVLYLIPDFSRFDTSNFLLKGYAVETALYGSLLEYIFIYAIIMLVVGVIAFRLRDV